MNEHGAMLRKMYGYPDLLVNLCMDEWEDGLMYSALLCTLNKNNNSAIRRRSIAFAEKPAIESTYNIQKLLDDACILKLEMTVPSLAVHSPRK